MPESYVLVGMQHHDKDKLQATTKLAVHLTQRNSIIISSQRNSYAIPWENNVENN